MKITVCAFNDHSKHSVAYRDFATMEEAVTFYRTQLERENVNVISTRKVKE